MAARTVVKISRTGTDLTLGEGTIYRLPPNWLNAGTSDYRRGLATAPNSPGRTITDRTLDVVTFTAKFNIGEDRGPSAAAELLTALGDLIDAVRQDVWTFQVTYDTTAVMKWKCEPAAITPDFNHMFLQGWLPVTLTVARHPIPVTGPF